MEGLRSCKEDETRATAAWLLAQRPYFVPARLILIGDAEKGGDRWQAMRGY